MIAKFFAGLLKSLLIDFVSWAYQAVKRSLARRKRVKKTQEAASEIENAKSPQDVLDRVDDLP